MMNWHAHSANDTLLHYTSNAHRGLSSDEAAARLEKDGPNELPEAKRRGPIGRLIAQINSPLIYVLIVAGTITFLLDDYLDTWVIGAVVVINAIIGFIQEGKAEKALDAVRGLLADHAVVIRDGATNDIVARDLVVGDVIQLESGSKVPADARLVHVRNLAVAEALLTGESVPVSKHTDPVGDTVPLGDRTSMVYAGTLVTSGTATAVVTATATDTELGKIGTLVGEVGTIKTPLSKRLDRFATQITAAILIIGAAAFAYGYLILGTPTTDLFLSVVGLAVAAIPEGLPAIVTIVLAIGTRAMASTGALIRRLPAVESLGSVSIIWSDKTGTLTQNEMTVASVVTATGRLDVTGTGYGPNGVFLSGDDETDPNRDDTVMTLITAGVLCNRAEIRHESSGDYVAVGDPTEAALVTLGMKAGLSRGGLIADAPMVDQIPFESERRFMATLHDHPGEGNRTVWLKGAPERIFDLATTQWGGAELDLDWWQDEATRLAKKGQRVLAIAGATWDADREFPDDNIPTGIALIGLVGVIDPPREAARDAILACQQAGISVKMITGDHIVTAAVIGAQLGLNADTPLSGSEIDHLDDAQLLERIEHTDVIARANPEHKLRLVKLVQSAGYQAAMTGDGVNDAPALQAADIGVAMGKKGTDAARQASDLVLTDDRFETIEKAVERGRVVFDNIKKSMLFILPTNLGEAGIILVALVAGWMMPITASQILWVNMVTAVTLSLALVVERAEGGLMARPPRPANEPLITARLLGRIILVGVLLLATTLSVFWWQIGVGASVEQARTAAVAMLVVAEVWYLFNARRFTQSGFTRETFLGSRMALLTVGILVALQLGFTYLPFMNDLFGTAPLTLDIWLVTIALGGALFVVVEIEKWLWRKRGVNSF
jgi:magnesium-transporting ATPase (P-type)